MRYVLNLHLNGPRTGYFDATCIGVDCASLPFRNGRRITRQNLVKINKDLYGIGSYYQVEGA